MTAAVDDGPEETRVQKRNLVSLIIAHIGNDSFFGFLPPLLPLLVVKMDMTLSMAGLLASAFAFTGAVGQPLFGYFADRYRKSWLIALGPIGGAFMTLLIYMPNYWSILLLFLFAGSGSACFHPVASVIAAQISGKRKGLGVSLYVSGGRIGMGLGAAFSTFLVTNWGLESIPIAGLMGLALGLPYFFIAPEITSPSTRVPMNFMDTMGSLAGLYRPLIVMWLVNVCRTTVTMLVGTYMPLYVVTAGGSTGAGGRSITLFLFAAAMGGIYGGHLSDRIGRRTVMIVATLLGTPVLGVTFLMPAPLDTIFLMLSGAILYSSMGVSVAYAQEVAPENRALVSSLMLGVVWFVGSMIAIGVGALGDIWGILTVLPITIVVFGGLGAVISFWLPKLDKN
ncbi:MAG: MFS transporter [Nitrospinaceae bacterium]|nr:MFS transporter [Nitrospinaceae bacterium]